MDELKDKGKRVIENIGEKRVDIIQKWEEKSRDFIDTFLLLFGRDRISHLWNESKGRLMQALSPPSSPTRDGSPASSTHSLNGDGDGTSFDFDEKEIIAPRRKSARYEKDEEIEISSSSGSSTSISKRNQSRTKYYDADFSDDNDEDRQSK